MDEVFQVLGLLAIELQKRDVVEILNSKLRSSCFVNRTEPYTIP